MSIKKTNAQSSKKKTINLYDLYEEKREYPRVTVNSLVEVDKKGEHSVNAILYDVSPDGVQIRCNRKTAHTIHPSGKFITESTAPEIFLKFTLPINASEKDVLVHTKLYYFSIIANDVVAFGGKFKEFENFTDRHVEAFIMNSFVPVENKVLDILQTPHTSDDLMQQMDDENINLDDTLNLLRKKKAIVSYEQNNTKKFIKLESAIEEIFKRLDKIESQLANY